MGTFHTGKGDLHGMTVVVDTHGTEVWVGRCDTVLPEGVVLLDADVHDVASSEATKDDFVAQAARVGVWKKHDRVLVPAAQVASIRRLGALRET